MRFTGCKRAYRKWICMVAIAGAATILIRKFVWIMPPGADQGRCDSTYRLTSLLQPGETATRGLPLCRVERLNYEQLGSCLRRRRRRQDRPTSVMLMGNSRLRHLYQDLGLRRGLPVGLSRRPDNRHHGDIRWSTANWCSANSAWCDRHAASDLLALQFFWRPFLSSDARNVLTAAAEACEAATRACPDLVIINAEVWYAVDSDLLAVGLPRSWLQRALLFRRQVAEAAAELRRLARLTRVIWKLDERLMHDAFDWHSAYVQFSLSTLHSVVFELKAKIPELTVWTSGLPATTSFLRRICYRLQAAPKPWSPLRNKTFNTECGDMIHGGPRIRQMYVDAVVADLCAVETTPAEEAEQTFCCGAFQEDDGT